MLDKFDFQPSKTSGTTINLCVSVIRYFLVFSARKSGHCQSNKIRKRSSLHPKSNTRRAIRRASSCLEVGEYFILRRITHIYSCGLERKNVPKKTTIPQITSVFKVSYGQVSKNSNWNFLQKCDLNIFPYRARVESRSKITKRSILKCGYMEK